MIMPLRGLRAASSMIYDRVSPYCELVSATGGFMIPTTGIELQHNKCSITGE